MQTFRKPISGGNSIESKQIYKNWLLKQVSNGLDIFYGPQLIIPPVHHQAWHRMLNAVTLNQRIVASLSAQMGHSINFKYMREINELGEIGNLFPHEIF